MQVLIETATKTSKINATMSGTTVSVAVHRLSDNKLFTAYCGDSRIVMGKKSGGKIQGVALTKDHKPDQKEERRRIEANGGVVKFDGFANHRVYARGASYPGLNMSRALGDLMGYYDAGISCEPTVAEYDVTGEDQVLIVCSDGIWEFIDDQEAATIVLQYDKSKAMEASEKLARQAWDRWMREEAGMVVDDITALAIYLV